MRPRWFGLHVVLTALAAALAGAVYSAPSLPEPVEAAAKTITADDLRAHVRFLASDELQGRGTGAAGNQVAELYLASVFERLQLGRPTGVAYLQPFDVYFSKLGTDSALTAGMTFVVTMSRRASCVAI